MFVSNNASPLGNNVEKIIPTVINLIFSAASESSRQSELGSPDY